MRCVEFEDLLRLPYKDGGMSPRDEGLDCLGACATILGRCHGHEARARFVDLAEGNVEPGTWYEVSEVAPQLGDIALSTNHDGSLHVSAVASLDPPLVLSSAHGYGVFTQPLSQVPHLIGVYRDPKLA